MALVALVMHPTVKNVSPMKTRTLKNGAAAHLVMLTAEHIDQILALQDIALAELTEAEKTFLLKKSRAQLEKHFAGGHEALGMVHGNRLIAQSLMVYDGKHGSTTLQGVVVDPAYRGNSLMAVMVEEWLDHARATGRTHARSEVDPNNNFSWNVFLQKGLHIDNIGIDPADGATVYRLHAHLPSLAQAFNAAAKRPVLCPQKDLEKQRGLLARGFRAVAYDAANDRLVFHRRRHSACL